MSSLSKKLRNLTDTIFPGTGSQAEAAGSAAADIAKGIVNPKQPEVPGMPGSAPNMQDPAIAEAERREREAQMKARGRASTILTGGTGDTSTATTAKRKLMGI